MNIKIIFAFFIAVPLLFINEVQAQSKFQKFGESARRSFEGAKQRTVEASHSTAEKAKTTWANSAPARQQAWNNTKTTVSNTATKSTQDAKDFKKGWNSYSPNRR